MATLLEQYRAGSSEKKASAKKTTGTLLEQYRNRETEQPKIKEVEETKPIPQPSDLFSIKTPGLGGGSYFGKMTEPTPAPLEREGLTYGGVETEKNKERDHIISIFLSGADTPENIKMRQSGNLIERFLDVPVQKVKERQEGKYKKELEIYNKYKDGKIGRAEAITEIKRWEFEQESKASVVDIAKGIPSEFGKIVKDFGDALTFGLFSQKKTERNIPFPADETISSAPKVSFWNKAKNIISKSPIEVIADLPVFKMSPEDQKARESVAYTISQKYDIPQEVALKNLDALTKDLGIRTSPTTMEIVESVIALPIVAGLASSPISTGLGILGFMGLAETESFIISKLQGKDYKAFQQKGLDDLLPADTNKFTKNVVEILDFIGKGKILHSVYKKSPEVKDWLTKKTIEEYKLPETVYFEAAKVKDIFQTKTKISAEEQLLISRLGLDAKGYKRAIDNGLTVEIPTQKIVTVTDKPYWAKLKNILRLKPTSPIVQTFGIDKPIEAPRALLAERATPLEQYRAKVAPKAPEIAPKQPEIQTDVTPGGIPVEPPIKPERAKIENARDGAKSLIEAYVKRGETIQQLKAGQLGEFSGTLKAEIGGYIDGKRISTDKIIVEEIEGVKLDPPQIFKLQEIYNEIVKDTVIKDVVPKKPAPVIEQKVNWKIEKQKEFEFCQDCTVAGSGDDIAKMLDTSQDISYNQFISVVSKDKLADIFPQYKWKAGDESPLKIQDDYAVSYSRGIFKGQPAYYVTQSGIEHIFVNGTKLEKIEKKPTITKEPEPAEIVGDNEILKPTSRLIKFQEKGDRSVKTPAGEFTNGYWLLKPEFAPKKLVERMYIKDVNFDEIASDEQANSTNIWNDAREGTLTPVSEIVGYIENPKSYVLKISGEDNIVVNKFYYDYLKKNIPNFSLKATKDYKPLIIYSGNKEAGLLMPIKNAEKIVFLKKKSTIKKVETKAKPIKKVVAKKTKPTISEEKPQAMSAKKWDVKMSAEPEISKKINKTQIMDWVGKTFGVPIKSKATFKWKAAGVYYPKAQIVRMEKWGEFSVATHEVAHHIDRQFRKILGRDWYKPNRTIIKELADLDYDQRYRRTSEGFAEYMRYRLTTDTASQKAPEFHKFFNKFLDTHQDLKTKISGFKKRLDIWHKQGAENRVIQHIDWKGEHTEIKGIMPKLKRSLKFINEKFNDEFYVPQKITSEIEKTIGKKLKPTENPAIMMEYSKSKAGAIARTFVMDSAIDEYGNVIGPSLVDVLKPIPNKEMPQFIAYAVSLRALNLDKRKIESGFDTDDAKFIIEKYKDKNWDKVATELTDWSNGLLDWVIRAGGLKPDTSALMRQLNPIYLPFKRAFIDEAGVVKGVGGYVDSGGAVKGIKGSGRPIVNPIEAIIAQSRELIAKSQKIRIAKLFVDLSTEQGVGGFIQRVPAPMKATTFSASQIQNYITQVTGEIPTEELDDLLTVFTQDFKYNGQENIVSVWVDGKQKFYEIHPDLYESFKGIDPLKLGPVSKLLAPFSRMLRLGATGLKASFGLARNPFRDSFSYAVFSKRKGATVFDPIKGIYKDIMTKPGEATWRFKKLGGALSGQIGLDRAATQSTYDEMLIEKLGKKGKVLKVVKHPVNALRDILSVTEMGPRSAELEANYKKYTSDKWLEKHPDWNEEDAFVQAFNDAQDVTVNFTKSGKWAKQINEVTAFFNVAIRGPEKLFRSFKERPTQTFVKGLLWLTTIAVGSWYLNKDKDWYRNLPPAYKYNNLWFEVGDQVVRLPIPFELGTIFMSVPQATLDSYKDQDLKWINSLVDIAKTQIPDPTPSAFQPMIDIASNKNYLGVPIETAGLQYLYPTERKKEWTSKTSIAISKGLDGLGIKLSPIKLDYLIDSYSGGFLRQFRLSGSELSDYPVLGDLLLRDKNYPKRQLNEFFTDYERLGQKNQSNIATKTEEKEYNKIKEFYTFYNDIRKKIKKAKDSPTRLENYYKQVIEELKKYGYN